MQVFQRVQAEEHLRALHDALAVASQVVERGAVGQPARHRKRDQTRAHADVLRVHDAAVQLGHPDGDRSHELACGRQATRDSDDDGLLVTVVHDALQHLARNRRSRRGRSGDLLGEAVVYLLRRDGHFIEKALAFVVHLQRDDVHAVPLDVRRRHVGARVDDESDARGVHATCFRSSGHRPGYYLVSITRLLVETYYVKQF